MARFGSPRFLLAVLCCPAAGVGWAYTQYGPLLSLVVFAGAAAVIWRPRGDHP